jgi:hypothetical protein
MWSVTTVGEARPGRARLGEARRGLARRGQARRGLARLGKDFKNEVTMEKHRFTLILPLNIWERIKTLAERNRRPATQEIIIAILEYLKREGV